MKRIRFYAVRASQCLPHKEIRPRREIHDGGESVDE